MHRYRVTFISTNEVITYRHYATSESEATDLCLDRLAIKVSIQNMRNYVWFETKEI